mgnify:CR=1 FL=1
MGYTQNNKKKHLNRQVIVVTVNFYQKNNDGFSMTVNLSFCKIVRSIADLYKDLFDDEGICYNELCSFISIPLYGLISLSELVRAVPGAPSVSSLSDAVNKFNGNRFMKRLRRSILRKYKGELNLEDFCIAIDDTDNIKYGTKLHRVGKWKSSKGIYFGQRVVVMALVDIKSGYAIPLDYRFAIKDTEPDYKSGLDLAVEMLEELVKLNFPRLTVVYDSWFDSVDLMRTVDKMGFTFVVELKCSRNAHSGKHAQWKNIKSIFTGLLKMCVQAKLNPKNARDNNKKKWFSQITLYVTNSEILLNAISMYNRKNSLSTFAIYATNDLTMSGAKLWKFSRARWKIECLFRDLKQNLSWGKLGCSGEEGADLAVCIPFIVYTFLTINFKGKRKMNSQDSIGTIVDKIRDRQMGKTINSLVIGKGLEKKKLKLLRARTQQSRVNKKPINKFAEKYSSSEKKAA